MSNLPDLPCIMLCVLRNSQVEAPKPGALPFKGGTNRTLLNEAA